MPGSTRLRLSSIRTKLTSCASQGALMATPSVFSRPTPLHLGLVLGVIGLGGPIASLRSQDDPVRAPVLGLVSGPGTQGFEERLFGNLAPEESAKWIDGFETVLRLGPAVVPLIDGFLEVHEGEVTYLQVRIARSLALAAAREGVWPDLASGRGRGRGSAEPTDLIRARFLAQLSTALGAPVRGDWPDLATVATSAGEPIVRASALAALTRFEGRELSAETLRSATFRMRGDSAPVSALAFRVVRDARVSWLDEWRRVARRLPEASLVHRGYFLSPVQVDPHRATDGDLRRLRWALGRPGVDPELVRSVLLHLARSGLASEWVKVLGDPLWNLRSDPRWVRCLGEDAGFRRLLLEAGSLRRSELDDQRSQARIAVLFARASTGAELLAAAPDYEGETRRALALAVALRLAEGGGERQSEDRLDAEAIADALGEAPESALIRFLGDSRSEQETRLWARSQLSVFQSAPLRNLLGQLASSASVFDAERFGQAIRTTLFELGFEPDLERKEADRALVRDCLLTGSRYGDTFGIPRGLRVDPPAGLSFEDRSFAIGVSLYDVLSRPGSR